MKLLKIKHIAVIIFVVIIASTFMYQHINFDNRDNNQVNSNNYFPELDSYKMFEEDAISKDANFQMFKTCNTLFFSLYKTCILVGICNFANIFKWKNSAVINFVLIYHYSVFVAIFSNKKDGKKRMPLLFT
ncbi:MAG: hypothetical protein ACERLG_07245 [Sedimentibacter sp.]